MNSLSGNDLIIWHGEGVCQLFFWGVSLPTCADSQHAAAGIGRRRVEGVAPVKVAYLHNRACNAPNVTAVILTPGG